MKRWWLIPEVAALALVGALLWRVAVPIAAYGAARVEGGRPGPWQAREQVVTSVPSRPSTAYHDPAFTLSFTDLRQADLSSSGQALRDQAVFDSRTRWPGALPAGFDPARFMELGKDPGLRVRQLHQQGITGQGVRVAYVDQALLVDHQEYRDRIERYIQVGQVDGFGTMHGGAVASILAGKSVGVAPEVSLTYYAAQWQQDRYTLRMQRDLSYLARIIQEILDQNERLPRDQRIRAIGASVGPGPTEPGYSELRQAIERAHRAGVLVVVTNTEEFLPGGFMGMNRQPDADPNDPASYGPGSFRAEMFWRDGWIAPNVAMLPMDSRCTAAESGTDEYRFYRQGGESWTVPYVVGLYALAAQVNPDITPDQFLVAARTTGTMTTIEHGGRSFQFGPIANPAALIERVRSR